jgi:hypothetical protein
MRALPLKPLDADVAAALPVFSAPSGPVESGADCDAAEARAADSHASGMACTLWQRDVDEAAAAASHSDLPSNSSDSKLDDADGPSTPLHEWEIIELPPPAPTPDACMAPAAMSWADICEAEARAEVEEFAAAEAAYNVYADSAGVPRLPPGTRLF